VREEMERDAARGGTRKGWVMAIPNCQFVPNYQLQTIEPTGFLWVGQAMNVK